LECGGDCLTAEVKPDFVFVSNGLSCSFDTVGEQCFYDLPVILARRQPAGAGAVRKHLVMGGNWSSGRPDHAPLEQVDRYWHGDYSVFAGAA
jgi:hypothetical protein